MLQRGGKTVPSGGQTSGDGAGPVALGRQQQQQQQQQHHSQPQSECARFPEWIDSSLDPTDTEVSRLVTSPASPALPKSHQRRCCRTSTSSGYSSHSPPLSGASYTSACCPTSGPSRAGHQRNPTSASDVRSVIPAGTHHQQPQQHQLLQQQQQQQQIVGVPSLAVIHESDAIPRPIWPCMSDDDSREVHPSAAVAAAGFERCRRDLCACCGYCYACTTHAYRSDSCVTTTSGSVAAAAAASSSAREVLLELSRTLNSVIDADADLTAEEILRDISIAVARGIQPGDALQTSLPLPPVAPPAAASSGICEDYTYRLSSSSSSAGGRESVAGVNPVNLRVYGRPKWLHAASSSRSSSSRCPYEGKTLLTAAQHASRTRPAHGGGTRSEVGTKRSVVPAPAVFLVPQGNCVYPAGLDAYAGERKGVQMRQDAATGKFDGAKRTTTHTIGRLNAGPGENCGEKCGAGEPVYTTQLDGSDESSAYGAIDEPPPAAKKGWNEGAKAFDRHLDFTLDGNRAERLGRAIAKAKRKRQWCRGLTAIFGLVFFVLSVVVVSLSVTRGRKVFGSM